MAAERENYNVTFSYYFKYICAIISENKVYGAKSFVVQTQKITKNPMGTQRIREMA